MKYVAGYLLAVLGGNKSPSAEDLKKSFASVGAAFEEEKAKKVISELNGKDLEELIQKGSARLATIPSGGGGGAAPAAAGGAPAAGGAADKKEEAKKEEEEEEEDEDMGFSLFD